MDLESSVQPTLSRGRYLGWVRERAQVKVSREVPRAPPAGVPFPRLRLYGHLCVRPLCQAVPHSIPPGRARGTYLRSNKLPGAALLNLDLRYSPLGWPLQKNQPTTHARTTRRGEEQFIILPQVPGPKPPILSIKSRPSFFSSSLFPFLNQRSNHSEKKQKSLYLFFARCTRAAVLFFRWLPCNLSLLFSTSEPFFSRPR